MVVLARRGSGLIGGGFVVPVRRGSPAGGGMVVLARRGSGLIGGGFAVPVRRGSPAGGGFVVPARRGSALIGGGFVVPARRGSALIGGGLVGAGRRSAGGSGCVIASRDASVPCVGGGSRGGASAGIGSVVATFGVGGTTAVGSVRVAARDDIAVGARGGSCTPVAGALRARRGGSGGSLRPHCAHVPCSSVFSALQNGQNLTSHLDRRRPRPRRS